MKLIHSYWLEPTISSRMGLKNVSTLDFYTFLLSALQAKKYYGNIDMYTDDMGYEKFVKYIPYDNIHFIKPNISSKVFWFYSKLLAMKEQNETFIHLDGDVIIFDKVFDKWIKNKKKVIVQQIEDDVYYNSSYENSVEDLYKRFIPEIEWDKYKKAYNTGIIGWKDQNLKDEYIKNVENVIEVMMEPSNYINYKHLVGKKYSPEFTAEQLYLYHFLNEKKSKPELLLSEREVKKYGHSVEVGNKKNFVHLWGNSKYSKYYLNKIKDKIFTLFPEYTDAVKEYDKKIDYENYRFFSADDKNRPILR